jgi:aminomethyltransferase
LTKKTRKTQLYDVHKRTAELMVFGGFGMPIWYKGIMSEHLAVRSSVGVFDISHMGRVIITGIDAETFINHVITNDVSVLSPNDAQYSVMCNEKGGIIDDFVTYRLEKEKFLVVYNAGHTENDCNWLVRNSKGFNVEIDDLSDDIAMFAVQGPNAEKTLQRMSTEDLSRIKRFKCGHTQLAGVEVFLSRTGYTGEDGFEIFVWNASLTKPDNALRLWNAILEAGKSFGMQPCGLGARDTLRLEAGLCLYGNDIDENTTPLEARLSFVVKFNKADFIGKKRLQKQKVEGIERKRVGVQIVERGVPRPKFEIYNSEGEKIGYVTSGTFSPLLKRGIAMGYVQTPQSREGNMVDVKIRGKLAKGRIVRFPFYDGEKYGYKRKIIA